MLPSDYPSHIRKRQTSQRTNLSIRPPSLLSTLPETITKDLPPHNFVKRGSQGNPQRAPSTNTKTPTKRTNTKHREQRAELPAQELSEYKRDARKRRRRNEVENIHRSCKRPVSVQYPRNPLLDSQFRKYPQFLKNKTSEVKNKKKKDNISQKN